MNFFRGFVAIVSVYRFRTNKISKVYLASISFVLALVWPRLPKIDREREGEGGREGRVRWFFVRAYIVKLN